MNFLIGILIRRCFNGQKLPRGLPDQARIIIPTVFRDNYISALKALTHNSRFQPLISALDFAQNYTSLIDWSNFDKANAMLTKTHAFEEAREAEYRGVRLTLPDY